MLSNIYYAPSTIIKAIIFVLTFSYHAIAVQQYSQVKNLKIGYIGKYPSLEPSQIKTIEQFLINSAVFASLVKLDSSNKIQAGVAKKWTVQKQFSIYQFTIDSSKYFYSGRPVQCTDVLNSFMFFKAKKINKSILNVKRMYCEKNQFFVHLSGPSRNFLNELSRIHYSIFLRENNSIFGLGDYSVNSKNNGNFTLSLKNHIKVDTHQNPKIITLTHFKSREEAVIAFRKGIIDFIPKIEYKDDLNTIPENVSISNMYNRIDGVC